MRLTILAMLLLAGLFIISCSGDNPLASDNDEAQPPALAMQPDYTITLPDPVSPDDYDPEEIEYQEQMVTAYNLRQFVEVDNPSLFAYQIVATDDYSPRMAVAKDLHWSLFSEGFLIPERDNRIYISDLPQYRPFNVKFAHHINLYRKIDVITAGEDLVMFETGAMPAVTLELNDEQVQAIPLRDFITPYITTVPNTFNYHLRDVHGELYILTWTDIFTGYYLTETDLIIVPGSSEGNYRDQTLTIDHPYSIELHEL